MLPGTQTPANIPQQLFFCYNRLQNDILYTNTPMGKYFGLDEDWRQLPLFRHPGWQLGLRLQAEGEYCFSFGNDGGTGQFTCCVKVAGSGTGKGFEDLLMCEVTPAESSGRFLSRDEYEEFIQLAAHDLDAPLRKLGVLVERLTARLDPGSEAAVFVPRIEANVNDMRSMIEGLTDLANAGITGSEREVDLALLVKDIVAGFRKKYTQKNVVAEIDALPFLYADPASMRDLFRNLIENAILFSKNDDPFLKISATEASETELKLHSLQTGTKFYKITVLDRGIGFDPRDAEKIFRPFVRLHGKSTYPGSGLGLAICKKIVERYQGIIYSEAIENEGARFILILPQSLN